MWLGEALVVLLWGAGGVFLLTVGVRDLRRGSTKLRHFRAEVRTDPTGYWMVVGLELLVGTFACIVAAKETFFGF